MFDLVIRNANLANGLHGHDIGISSGKITAIEKSWMASSGPKLMQLAGW